MLREVGLVNSENGTLDDLLTGNSQILTGTAASASVAKTPAPPKPDKQAK